MQQGKIIISNYLVYLSVYLHVYHEFPYRMLYMHIRSICPKHNCSNTKKNVLVQKNLLWRYAVLTTILYLQWNFLDPHIIGLMQVRRNSTATALELRLSCTNPLMWWHLSIEIDPLCVYKSGCQVLCRINTFTAWDFRMDKWLVHTYGTSTKKYISMG